jgi:alpha-amylase
MTEVSARLAARSERAGGDDATLAEARTHLYKSQCNCSYWHGAFGGLYLPHLRNAVYKHLIAADGLLDEIDGRSGKWCAVAARDYDLDARKEVRLSGDKLVAYLKPSRGGAVYELDVRGAGHNLLATLDRRPEPYHNKILAHAAKSPGSPSPLGGAPHDADGDASVSIHDLVQFKQPDLDQKLGYDLCPTKAFVDRFLEPGLTREEFRAGRGGLCDSPTGVFETTLKRSAAAATVVMTRSARLSRFTVGVRKTVTLAAGSNALSVRYQFSGLPAGRPVHFATAVHLAGLAGSADDRYFYDAEGSRRGTLDTPLNLPATDRVGVCDEWLGLDAALELGDATAGGPGGVWTHPVETVSGSEAGFESVFQSCAVVPHWEFLAPADGRWAVDLTLTCDASAAQARKLDDAPLRRAA